MYALDVVCFQPPFRFSRAAMRRFAEAENALVRLASIAATEADPEQMLGFCIVHLERTQEGQVGYVVTLDVAPAWRGQGIAQALMRSLEAAAAEGGARAMALHVFSGNLAAIRLYERLGYLYTRRTSGFYGPGLDALVYSRPLSAATQPVPVTDALQDPE